MDKTDFSDQFLATECPVDNESDSTEKDESTLKIGAEQETDIPKKRKR